MFSRTGGDQLLGQAVGGRSRLEHDEAARHLSLHFVGDADHRALRDGWVGGEHRLD